MRTQIAVLLAVAGCSFDGEDVDTFDDEGVDDGARVVSADVPLPADLLPGDVIERAGIGVVIPEAGEQVQLVGELDDGSSLELTVRNVDGLIEIIEHLDDHIGEHLDDTIVLEAGGNDPCKDGAFNLAGHKWTTTYRWRFHAGSTPGANSRDNVETGLVRAVSAITSSRNSCGLADQVSATHDYLGRTATRPNIRMTTSGVRCGNADGHNVVGFGPLPSNFLAVACSWTVGNQAVEGDVRFDSARRWYALGVPSGCSNRFGIQAVGAHEFGHVFGLGHVSESAHPNLTMSTAARACSNAPLSLGLGDVRALRRLY